MNILIIHKTHAQIAPMISSTISDYHTRLYERSVAQVNAGGQSLRGHNFQLVVFSGCAMADFNDAGLQTLGWILAGAQIKTVSL